MDQDQTQKMISPLMEIEARLRKLLPAKLYAEAWIKPNSRNLTRVLNHLRTLNRILYDYLPRQVLSSMPIPGEINYQWETGTLMFTDLAGFTPLLEANARLGEAGAASLLATINAYFTEIIQIISKAGGNLLEFTGDAILVQFPPDQQNHDTDRAARAGLRMQRAMQSFSEIQLEDSTLSLAMRIGLHVGRFLTADIGNPHRMEHVLLGAAVQRAKLAESAGRTGQVCLSQEAQQHLKSQFTYESIDADYSLIVDDLSDEQLGDYDILPSGRRFPKILLLDHSVPGLVQAISEAAQMVEPLASFIPDPVFKLLVENAARRGFPPEFSQATVMFINLLGLPPLEDASPEEVNLIITHFSRLVSLINAEIESQGGVLKKVTYHLAGPDIMTFFGVPNAHANDSLRAAQAALAIMEIVNDLEALPFKDGQVKVSAHIGITRGQVFTAELGETQGRREFNVLGDTVNTAARLMNRAQASQILITGAIHDQLQGRFPTQALKPTALKGKSAPVALHELLPEG